MGVFRVLVLAIALVAGGAAAYLALNINSQPQEVVELAPQIISQDVLVASTEIKQGQALTPENMRWQRWPEEGLDPSVIKKNVMPDAMEKLNGSVVRLQFVAGEPIREQKLARPETGFMSAILPAGKRAIAVRISAQNTAGGFILPNDRVDLIQTVTEQASENAPAVNVSRSILSNVRVLAIDQMVEEQNGETVVVGKTATLELDPAQVDLVTAAEASGTLSLALRSFADTDEAVSSAEERRGPIRIFRSGVPQTVSSK